MGRGLLSSLTTSEESDSIITFKKPLSMASLRPDKIAQVSAVSELPLVCHGGLIVKASSQLILILNMSSNITVH